MKKMYKKITSFLLKLLGFSSTFVLAACYGPAPTGYREDQMVVDGDSVAVVDLAEEDADSMAIINTPSEDE